MSNFTRHPFLTVTGILSATAAFMALVTSSATAGHTSLGGGDFSQIPYYSSQVFGGIDRDHNADPGFAAEDSNSLNYSSNLVPRGVTYVDGSVAANGASFRGIGQAVYSGFYAGRNYAQISVTNADADDTYYQVAGTGTATSVRFFDASAAAARAVFTWTVSGTVSNPAGVGTADGRLDFGASTDPSVNWLHLFDDPNSKLDSFTQYGPGTYSYTLPNVPLGTTINLFYWSSAYASIEAGDVPAGTSAVLTANFSNTFELTNVQLFDNDDNPISSWTLEDLTTNEIVFNQDGRLTGINPAPPLGPAVPEPGTWVLLSLGLTVRLIRGRRRR